MLTYDGTSAVNGVNGVSTFISGAGIMTGNIKELIFNFSATLPAITPRKVGQITNRSMYPTKLYQKNIVLCEDANVAGYGTLYGGVLYINTDGAISLYSTSAINLTYLNIAELYI